MQQVLELEQHDVAPTLGGKEVLDFCIVGGGFTGLWTALAIIEDEPTARVGVLESDICGAGASGANGGFAMTWWPKFASLKKMMSSAEAVQMAVASQEAVARIGAFCADHSIDAGFSPAGWLWTATNASQVGSWNECFAAAAATGVSPFTELSQEQVTTMSGSERHRGGVLDVGAATVQPAALVRGLRDVAISKGVRVWEGTPMLELSQSSREVVLKVPEGSVKADQVVLATNAWLAHYVEVRRHLLVLGSDVVATAPSPACLAAVGWASGIAISDSRRLVQYYRTTDDGRVVYGKGGGRIGFRARMNRELWATPLSASVVANQFRMTYPSLSDVPITNEWSGAVDYSSDSLPFFGSLGRHQRVHYGAGYSGNGVGPSYLGGQILASMALGRDDQWRHSPMIRTPKAALPPEPLRALGGRIVRRALVTKESAEDRGETSSPLTRRIAKLDHTKFA